MRILMLSQFYPPTIGGEETQVRTLSQALAQRGHTVSVATLWHKGRREIEDDNGVTIYRIKSSLQRAAWLFKDTDRRHAPPFPDPEAVLALRRVVAQEQPDIVHAHNWLVHSFLPLKSSSNAALVVTLHDYSLVCAKKRLMYEGAVCSGPQFTKCLKCAVGHYGVAKGVTTVLGNMLMGPAERAAVDMFLPVSNAVAAGTGLVGTGLPYQVLPNFVPDHTSDSDEEIDGYLERLPKEDYLLFVGDVGFEKGLDVLLAAYKQLASPPPLVLIGRTLSERPDQFPPNVIPLNSLPHRAVMQAWKRSLAVLVPSVWPEPFGIVVIEAMASGNPVIASRIGGISDIVVDGETGVLVPPGDATALATAMATLLADPELRARMGEAGKRRVAEFQASAILPRIEAMYQSVIDARHLGTKPKVPREEQGYYSVEET